MSDRPRIEVGEPCINEIIGEIPTHLREIDKDNSTTLHYRCPGCGAAHHVVAPNVGPLHQKHRCRFCERVNEIQVRGNANDEMEALFEQGDDEKATEKKKSVNIKITDDTPWGRAALID